MPDWSRFKEWPDKWNRPQPEPSGSGGLEPECPEGSYWCPFDGCNCVTPDDEDAAR